MSWRWLSINSSVISLVASAALAATPAAAGAAALQPLGADRVAREDSTVRSIRPAFSVNFDRWGNGPYTAANAADDFGNASGWDTDKTIISGGRLRATLEPNEIGGAGGTLSSVDVSDGTEYEMQYTVNFHSQFDWSRGGKLGWGFAFGDGAGGCTRADGDGASLRLMWYTDNTGRTFFRPYLYHVGMPETCGDSFGRSYPSVGSLRRATDYVILIRVKSNTGDNKDGRAVIKVNGTTVLDVPVQWTDNDVKKAVRRIVFHTFRGGSQDYWASPRVGFVYYDNFSIKKIR